MSQGVQTMHLRNSSANKEVILWRQQLAGVLTHTLRVNSLPVKCVPDSVQIILNIHMN
jgi:hypothetical protein